MLDFVGKPLPYYTLSAIDLYLKRHTEIEYDIVVNSDSEALLQMLSENPMRKVELIARDPALAGYCEVIEMYDTGILDLDHENDFELMEVIAAHLFKKFPEYAEIRDNI